MLPGALGVMALSIIALLTGHQGMSRIGATAAAIGTRVVSVYLPVARGLASIGSFAS